jgi:hypothetical protein
LSVENSFIGTSELFIVYNFFFLLGSTRPNPQKRECCLAKKKKRKKVRKVSNPSWAGPWVPLAQLVKFFVIEQGTWVQIPPIPKINWCLGLMVRATIMSGHHIFKFYYNYHFYI